MKKVHADVQDSGGTCDQCGESSATTQGASVPKRVHSGRKPYRCRLCGEGSSSSNHLKQHMEIHANDQSPIAGKFMGAMGWMKKLVNGIFMCSVPKQVVAEKEK